MVIPKGRVPSLNETLIDLAAFPKFIRKVYAFYSRSHETELLDNAIFALVNERAALKTNSQGYSQACKACSGSHIGMAVVSGTGFQ
jgi:hypothetical protein